MHCTGLLLQLWITSPTAPPSMLALVVTNFHDHSVNLFIWLWRLLSRSNITLIFQTGGSRTSRTAWAPRATGPTWAKGASGGHRERRAPRCTWSASEWWVSKMKMCLKKVYFAVDMYICVCVMSYLWMLCNKSDKHDNIRHKKSVSDSQHMPQRHEPERSTG